MNVYPLYCAVVISIIFTTSCGPHHTSEKAEAKYLAGQPSFAGLTLRVHQSHITVCMNPTSASESHKHNVLYAIDEWTSALESITNRPVVKTVVFKDTNHPSCDVTVLITSIDRAQTRMGYRPVVTLNYNGWFGSKTVMLHEFGHAFGLLDTYYGTNASCKRGQPSSVMCDARYDALTADDVAGIRAVYRRAAGANFREDDEAETKIVY